MIICLTRFVGTQLGVLRTYPGLRLQKTYSHRQQSWSVYDCIISELTGKERRENIYLKLLKGTIIKGIQLSLRLVHSSKYSRTKIKQTQANKKHQIPVKHLSFYQ